MLSTRPTSKKLQAKLTISSTVSTLLTTAAPVLMAVAPYL